MLVCKKCGSNDLSAKGACRPCLAAYMRAWNASPSGQAYAEKRKVEKAAYAKRWYEQDIDKRRQYQRYRANTPEGRKNAALRQIAFKQNNPEKFQAIRDRYYATEKGKLKRWSTSTSQRIQKTSARRQDGRLQDKPGGDVTALQLRELWASQQGKCVVTGVDMVMVTGKQELNSVSVDRIDPTKPYTIDNIRLVTYQANCAKLFGTDEDLLEFCRRVISHAERNVSLYTNGRRTYYFIPGAEYK